MSLEGRGLRYGYPRAAADAVRDVSLAVRPGELQAVVGPNGAGKSTLLALLAGWLRPLAGEVRLDGRPLGDVSPRARARRVAYLPQRVEPLYDLTVEETVLGGRHPHRSALAPVSAEDRAAVRRALADTDTAGLAPRPFRELSGGERQRVLLASVLAQGAGFLLLDEPTAALDPHHGATLFRLLRTAADAGHGVMVVTHDLNLASLSSDRLVLLDRGAVAAAGAPAEVLRADILGPTYGEGLTLLAHPASGRPMVLPAGP